MPTDRPRRTADERWSLRPVEFHILLSLAAGERHGYGIIQDIQERGDAPVPDVGTMYRALARMVEAGLIEAAARRPAADAGDERRNYYRITEAGAASHGGGAAARGADARGAARRPAAEGSEAMSEPRVLRASAALVPAAARAAIRPTSATTWATRWWTPTATAPGEALRTRRYARASGSSGCARSSTALRNGPGERLRPAVSWRRGGNWGRDAEFALRRLLRARAFAGLTIATLTIGLGMVAVACTVVDKVLIEPMPYRHPGDLYYVWRDYGPIVDMKRGRGVRIRRRGPAGVCRGGR